MHSSFFKEISTFDLLPFVLTKALLVLVVLNFGGCGGSGASTAPVSVPIVPPVTITGPVITDFPLVANDAAPGASTKSIQLAHAIGRGVNFGNMLEAPQEGDWGLRVTDDFIDKAALAGFTSVRLPVRWSNHADAIVPYTIDPVFLARVESVVDKLLAKKLIVILNMHHYRQLDGDALDVGEFSVADAERDVRFLVLWQQIATRFKDRGDQLLFELYNEPHGRLNGEPWNQLASRALGAVRKTNPTRAVVIGSTQWSNASALAQLKIPNDANLIFTIHNYEPFYFTHQGAEWISPLNPMGVTCCDTTQLAYMNDGLVVAKNWALAKNYPIFVGEFGAYNKGAESARIAYNRSARDAAELHGMSWTYWEFAAGFGIYDPMALVFRQNLLDSLLAR